MSNNESFCPAEIAKWNISFYKYVLDIHHGKKVLRLADLQEWWDERKVLEKETDCPEYWQFRQFYFIEIIETLDKGMAGDFLEQQPEPEEQPEVPF